MLKWKDIWFRMCSYAGFYLRSGNTKGYGVHSPYLFYIARAILPETGRYYCYDEIESLRTELLRSREEVGVRDYGVGGELRRVSKIARRALKPMREAQVLFRLVNMLKAKTIVELGTSLGVTTAYLASADSRAEVWTFEGSEALTDIAQRGWKKLGLHNIKVVQGNIDETLPLEEREWGVVDFAFMDANHRREATVHYFDLLARHAGEKSIFVVDDIRYNREMWDAWCAICGREYVTARMDLGSMGLVFFDTHFPKQEFRIRL